MNWRPNLADAAYHIRERIEEGDYASQAELQELKKEYRILMKMLVSQPSEDSKP